MNNLSLNVNVMKANTMLGMVEANTTVDRSVLLEDEGFCKLLTACAHQDTVAFGALLLTDYVNENY